MLADSCSDVGHLWNLDQRRHLYGTSSDKPDGDWDKTAELMMLTFAESGHPVFRATSTLEGGQLKSKGKEVYSLQR